MLRFRFGRNWQRYVRHYVTDEALADAERDLAALLGLPSLEGRSFLDIGSGSGVHSLAAHRLGAARVVSFDNDPDSVAATRQMHTKAGKPSHWEVMHGSVLDEAFLAELGTFDAVYSWGVLHHTGDMWRAISLAATRVAPGGRFVIAIYNKDEESVQGSEWWQARKRLYVESGPLGRARLLLTYLLQHQIIPNIRARRNPFAHKKKRRGMGYYTDVLDWIGGYPYEFASVDEIEGFCRDTLGLRHVRTNPRGVGGLSNNEFVFDRPPAGAT